MNRVLTEKAIEKHSIHHISVKIHKQKRVPGGGGMSQSSPVMQQKGLKMHAQRPA